MVNFVTSLESLFNVSSEQVGFLLRTRCAHFLEKDLQARIDLSDNLKEIYKLRSTFVHGQGLTQRVLDNQTRLNRLLSDSEEATRRCLQKIFDNNLVDLFGDLNNLKAEFQKLDLGLPNLLTV